MAICSMTTAGSQPGRPLARAGGPPLGIGDFRLGIRGDGVRECETNPICPAPGGARDWGLPIAAWGFEPMGRAMVRQRMSNKANLPPGPRHCGGTENAEMNVNATRKGSCNNALGSLWLCGELSHGNVAGIWGLAGSEAFRIMAGEIGSIGDRRGMIEESAV